MRVIEIDGEWFRFHVTSSTRPGVRHLVDLEENGFNGKCSCEHFSIGCQPVLDKTPHRGAHTRCIHIAAARDEWFRKVAPALAKELNKNKNGKTKKSPVV